jgi:hypothetical protein
MHSLSLLPHSNLDATLRMNGMSSGLVAGAYGRGGGGTGDAEPGRIKSMRLLTKREVTKM